LNHSSISVLRRNHDPIGPTELVSDVPPEIVAQFYEYCETRDELFELRPG
jgi:hypothetical protein